MDQRGRIEMFNRAAEGIFGYRAEEVVGHDVAILLPENLTRKYADGLQHFLATGESPLIGRTTEVSGRKQNGRLVPLALSLTAVRVNRRWLFTGLVRDLTAVKRAEKERDARVQQQAVVVRQGQRALACDDLGQLLEEMAQCVAQTLDVDNCLILELLQDGETLLAAGRGRLVAGFPPTNGLERPTRFFFRRQPFGRESGRGRELLPGRALRRSGTAPVPRRDQRPDGADPA